MLPSIDEEMYLMEILNIIKSEGKIQKKHAINLTSIRFLPRSLTLSLSPSLSLSSFLYQPVIFPPSAMFSFSTVRQATIIANDMPEHMSSFSDSVHILHLSTSSK